jgi:hypothetical protein
VSVVLGGAGLVAWLLACRGEQVHTIQLSYRNQRTGGISGFDCDESRADDAAVPLAFHALKQCGGSGRFSLAVDLIDTSGSPRCDTTSMSQWCHTHPCTVVPGSRVCVERDLPDDAGARRGAAINALAAAIRTMGPDTLTERAPDQFVLTRAVVTLAPCSEVLANTDYDCAPLLGCAISCPTNLTTFPADQIELALDLGPLDLPFSGSFVSAETRQAVCTAGIRICAGTPNDAGFGTCVTDGDIPTLDAGACGPGVP